MSAQAKQELKEHRCDLTASICMDVCDANEEDDICIENCKEERENCVNA